MHLWFFLRKRANVHFPSPTSAEGAQRVSSVPTPTASLMMMVSFCRKKQARGSDGRAAPADDDDFDEEEMFLRLDDVLQSVFCALPGDAATMTIAS